MKVCIAEKPSVAREIANVLGAKFRKDGYFEGNGYQVTWTFGHFCTLLPPQDYNSEWKKWQLAALPMLPEKFETKIMKDSGVKKQFKIIKSLFKKANIVINCGDAGTEGELIQRWVIKQAKYKGPVQRLWISSLTTSAIKQGFTQLRPASDFDNLYYAASSRAIGDWLLGMNATRLYTLKYGGYKQVLSIGRVQTPTLAMLVKRHYEILNFKPSPYWELQTLFRNTAFNYTKGKFEVKEKGAVLLEKITGQPLTIKKVIKKDGKEYAPKLFDLTALQVYCNNKFGYTADATLKLVQKLYEKKVVSYPRVDTTYLPNDVYPKVPGILKKLSNYSNFTAQLLNTKLRKSSKVFNDAKVTDHHAIIPTGSTASLNDQEHKVYDIIVRRFIAVFYPDCKVAKTQVDAEVASIPFVARGKEIIEEGWRVLFPKSKSSSYKKDSDKDEDKILPTFTQGETGPHQPRLLEKTTKPPKYYSEAALLRAMETAGKQVDDDELRELMKDNGIGRPSTRASIIETLFRRKYTRRQKKLILPTPLGIQLIDTIQNEMLKSAELTGQWEKRLKAIEKGTHSPFEFIANMKKMVTDLVTEVKQESGKAKMVATAKSYTSKYKKAAKPKSSRTKPTKTTSHHQSSVVSKNTSNHKSKTKRLISDVQCPKCQKGTIIKGKTSYGCSTWNIGCTLRVPFKFLDKKLSENQTLRLLGKRSTVNLKGFIYNGQKTEGLVRFDHDFNLVFQPKASSSNSQVVPKPYSKSAPTKKPNTNPNPPPCPKCHIGQLLKGQSAYGCTRWKDGCDFRFSFAELKQKAKGHTLTKELVLEILNGK